MISSFAAAALGFAAVCVSQTAMAQDYGTIKPPGEMPGLEVNPDAPSTRAPTPPSINRNFGTIIPNRRPSRESDFGATVLGPGGIVHPYQTPERKAEPPKKKALTAQEKAAAIRKALAPKPPLATARRHTLDDLYGKLASARDADEAKGLAQLITNIWLRTGSDTAALLMQRAIQATEKKQFPAALAVLDKIVDLQPAWAEAWNRRASVKFAAGDLDGAMSDVEHVLKLEPNHFAALQGMGMILQQTGFDKRALQVYRRALAVYPHQPELESIVQKLTLSVEGQGI